MTVYKDTDAAGNVTYTDISKLQRDMRAIVGKPTPAKTLPGRDAAAPIPATAGAAKPRLAGSNTQSTGIAGPITEPDAADRTYHAAYTTMTTSDGLFSIRIHHPETFKLQDGVGRPFDLTLDAS